MSKWNSAPRRVAALLAACRRSAGCRSRSSARELARSGRAARAGRSSSVVGGGEVGPEPSELDALVGGGGVDERSRSRVASRSPRRPMPVSYLTWTRGRTPSSAARAASASSEVRAARRRARPAPAARRRARRAVSAPIVEDRDLGLLPRAARRPRVAVATASARRAAAQGRVGALASCRGRSRRP